MQRHRHPSFGPPKTPWTISSESQGEKIIGEQVQNCTGITRADLADRESCIFTCRLRKVRFSFCTTTAAVFEPGLPRGRSLGSYHGSQSTPSEDPIRYVAPSPSYSVRSSSSLRVAVPHWSAYPPCPLTCATAHSSGWGRCSSLEVPLPARHTSPQDSSLISTLPRSRYTVFFLD